MAISSTTFKVGHKPSLEVREKIAKAHIGLRLHTTPHSEATKLKISLAKRGKKPWNYFEDRSLLKKADTHRMSIAHREWSRTIKIRDHWKCKINDGSCGGRLEAHHILSWELYPKLRYELTNGITLCHVHHPRRRKDERRLASFFKKLIRKDYFGRNI